MGGKLNREVTYVCLWLIHIDVWQKPTQYHKAIILQLKINLKKRSQRPREGQEEKFCRMTRASVAEMTKYEKI